MNELVHATGTQCGAKDLTHSLASVDVADELTLALRLVGALLEEDDLRLHHVRHDGKL